MGEVPLLGQKRPEAQPKAPEVIDAVCAYTVLILPDGTAQAEFDIDRPFTTHRKAKEADVINGNAQVNAIITATLTANATLGMMAMAGQRAAMVQQNQQLLDQLGGKLT